jgi:hypothetical protein
MKSIGFKALFLFYISILSTVFFFAAAEDKFVAQPPPNLQEFAEFLKNQPSSSVQFIQKRYVLGLNKPLESEGSITFSNAKQEIFWQINKPHSVQAVIKKDSYSELIEGKLIQSNDRVKTAVAKIIFALLHGNISILKEQFILNYSVENGAFLLEMKPKTFQFGKGIEVIQVGGVSEPSSIKIVFGKNDLVAITLKKEADSFRLKKSEKSTNR